MEYYWNMFNNSSSSGTISNSNNLRGHNSNFTTSSSHAWQYSSDLSPLNYPLPTAGGEFHALTQPDPHLMCLNLGKRHYFENANGAPPAGHAAAAMAKKGKLQYRENPSAAAAVVPRCQVEGCEAVLVKAKEYHKRHKVCEMHAKAPRVVVHGMEQRFCQQCSRFHGVGEFDEAKRSCRRRLAGHNERRRKTSQHYHPNSPLSRKPYHHQDIKMMSNAGTHLPHFLHSDCAHSLLSSTSISNIPASADLPARCTAALHELIVENRASFLAYKQQLSSNQIEDPDFNNYPNASTRVGSSDPRFFNLHENGAHVTLNLMQDPNSAFGLLSVHDRNRSSKRGERDEEDSCSELWKFPLGY